ncbi:MAG: GerMN domain-containing protein [Bacillota bacterium]
MKRPTAVWAAGLALVALTVASAVSGCSLLPFGRPSVGPGEDPVTPGPGQGEVTVVLYFADADAMHLLPEARVVTAGGESYAALVIRELLAGPRLEGHGRTIPDGVRLLSLEITEGVAYVNFSREIRTNHWGGSTGEMFTIMSIVNSLTEDPSITAVQFLIEGQRVESLVGHADLTVPIERNESLIKKGD